MSGILIAALLALATLAGLLLIARQGKNAALMPAAALMLGLAGYAWQGSPAQPGSPVAKEETRPAFDEEMAQQRRALAERLGPAGKWLVLSDGLARSGDSEGAANVLVAAVRDRPDDPALWVGLANALVGHGQGQLSPAADYAFKRALALDVAGFAPPYFYGLALAQSARFDEARAQWQTLQGRLPEQSDLRADVTQKLAVLDMIEASQTGEGAPPAR
jgi:cytochrome c-type biogenesis protein CcmH